MYSGLLSATDFFSCACTLLNLCIICIRNVHVCCIHTHTYTPTHSCSSCDQLKIRRSVYSVSRVLLERGYDYRDLAGHKVETKVT